MSDSVEYGGSDMWEMIAEGFVGCFNPYSLILNVLGVLVGIIFGAIPGLSGTLGIILFLPMTRSIDLLNSLIFLVGIFIGGEFGGSISAILIGTPGTNSAVCTMLEGYPMAKKGHARKALMMALVASTIGGLLSAFSLLFLAPPARALRKAYSQVLSALCFRSSVWTRSAVRAVLRLAI